MYKINLHAHTFFSDGANSPLKMAMEAKRLGFCSLVITDHFRNGMPYSNHNFSLCKDALEEAREIIPVILGMEILVQKHEMLLFGGEAVQKLLKITQRPLNFNDMDKIRRGTYCATILCHPGAYTGNHCNIVDGYERINGGQDWFKRGRPTTGLGHLPSWCNSDAHGYQNLEDCWNEVDTKITDEADLIKYIKKGKQPIHVNNRED